MPYCPLNLFRRLLVLAILLRLGPCAGAEVTVYAAASLTNALGEMARDYENRHPVRIKTSFAASGALAKQIEAGAPADLFISADNKWMDYLDGKGKIDHDSRVNLAGNSLAMITPRGRGFPVRFEKTFNFAAAFDSKLCTGETESVPVGMYAREALSALGWWDAIKYRVVGTDDVRAALDLVGRGECVGIVYATDATTSDRVEVAGIFPDRLHQPIVYPAALVTQSRDARDFLDYLMKADEAFAKYGFRVIK